MSKKIKVVLDFDSTIVNSVKSVCDTIISQKYHEIKSGLFSLPLDIAVTKWDLSDELPSLTKFDIDAIFCNPTFFKLLTFNIDPSGFSMEDLVSELCADSRFDVYICSLGAPENLRLKRKFIHERMPYIKPENILLLEFDKNQSMNKSVVQADIIVDDSAKVIKSVPHIPHRVLYCHRGEKMEWNEELFNYRGKGFYRADSVGQLNKLIHELFMK